MQMHNCNLYSIYHPGFHFVSTGIVVNCFETSGTVPQLDLFCTNNLFFFSLDCYLVFPTLGMAVTKSKVGHVLAEPTFS